MVKLLVSSKLSILKSLPLKGSIFLLTTFFCHGEQLSEAAVRGPVGAGISEFLSGLKLYLEVCILACSSARNVSNFCYILKVPVPKSLLAGFGVGGLVWLALVFANSVFSFLSFIYKWDLNICCY